MDEFLKTSAPFFYYNWHYILTFAFTISIAFGIRSIINKKPQSTSLEDSTRKNREKEKARLDDHPMSEFKDTGFDDQAASSLHSPEMPHVPYPFTRLGEDTMFERSTEFYTQMDKRRSVRTFSSDDVPIEVIRNIVKTAGTSPSGAHTEPWTFVVIRDKQTKIKMREIIEQEEYLNYNHRMGDRWVNDLKFTHTDHQKPYLETAPYVIIVFKQQYHTDAEGIRHAHYYYEISTALAGGILVTAIHNAGLCTVVTTPLNAGGQLKELLGRPPNEKVMLLLPVGYPAEDTKVPKISRKPIEDIMVVV